MGNYQASNAIIQYAVAVDESPTSDCSKIYRCAQYPDGLVTEVSDRIWENPWDNLACQATDQTLKDKPFLGSRLWQSKEQCSRGDGIPKNFVSWITYGELYELATAFARGLHSLNIIGLSTFKDERYKPAQELRLLGLISKNRPEWFIIEQASAASNLCLIPLYDSLGQEAFRQILEESQMQVLTASRESYRILAKHIALVDRSKVRLKNIILMDVIEEEDRKKAESIDVNLYYWKNLVELGRKFTNIKLDRQKREDVTTICYTSGTTGKPKGVLITAHNFVSTLAAHQRCIMSHPGFRTTHEDVHLSYLPLAHVFERLICADCIALGMKICCYSGDTQKLLDDMRIVQPTVFVSVPRLYMRIYDKITAALNDKSHVARFLFQTAVDTKLKNLREKGVYQHSLWDSLIFRKTRAIMGGKVKFMLVGAAPLASIIQESISVIFCCPLLHGFGMTEVGPVFICNPGEKVAGHIGGVQPCVEFIIKSVPESPYNVNSDECTGELCVRGPSVTPGYLSNIEETDEVIEDASRWFHTGDIVRLLPGNAIQIVDRIKNIFKLSQGEYVAPERLEMIYSKAPLVGQIFVFGDSSKSYLVGVVCPDDEELAKWKRDNPQGDAEALRTAILQSMQIIEAPNEVTGFQKVKKIGITQEQFSIENGLLTPTLKLRRKQCQNHFQNLINELYSSF